MFSLKEALDNAKQSKIAVGHFNVSDSTQFNAIVKVAKELNQAVIIGVSEGEEEFLGLENAVALVNVARKYGAKVFLNADHHRSFDACKCAIDAGCDSVIFDGADLSLEENIEKTRQVVDYARIVGAREGRHIIVEGELGYIGKSSKLLDKVPEDILNAKLPTVEDAVYFVEKTGVDSLAPAVGNLHGMLRDALNPSLNIDLIREIAKALPNTHLVLHGGSGLEKRDFKEAILAGINCVHINTEIRKAYKDGIKEAVNESDEIAPYKYFKKAKRNVEQIVMSRMKLFAGLI